MVVSKKEKTTTISKIEIVQKTSQESFFDNQKLFDFVSKGEGSFQEKAFCDSYYKNTGAKYIRHPDSLCTRYSIGFGTKSFRGEVITLKEGIKRRNEDILYRKSLITSNCLTEHQIIATVDFLYQHGNYSSNVKDNANRCNINAIYGMFTWWRDNYKNKAGLKKREQRRINYFYKN